MDLILIGNCSQTSLVILSGFKCKQCPGKEGTSLSLAVCFCPATLERTSMCEIIWLGYLHLILEHHKGVQVVPDKRLLINKPLASPSITVSDELHAFCVSFSSSLGKISSCRVLGAILQQGSKEITLQL